MMRRNDREIKPKPCLICMHCIKWIPVLFIFAVICWSYYAYIYELCILTVNSILLKILFIILYHFVLFLFLWAYWKTIFTPVATVPAKWRIPQAEIDKLMQAESQDQQKRILEYLAKDLPVCNRTMNGAVRFCDKCIIIKPDRAHHCSVCGVCVLKMDHHCPWVNNCVNFANYKYFVLFLAYALLYCIYVALTSLEYFVQFWQGGLNTGGNMGKFHILFLFFISVMFAISLVSLFGYHIYLVLFNRTTLEAFRAPIFRFGGPDKNGYNLGKMANFQEVFGDNWKMWFFPVNTSLGNGLQYRMQSPQQQQCATYESMGDTPTRLDDSSTSTDKFLNNFTATTTTNITVVPSTAINTNNTIHNNSTIHCSNNTVSNNIHTNSSSLINNIDDNNDYDNITKSTIVIDIEQEPLQSSNSTTRPQLIQNHQQEYINSNIIVDNPSGGNLLINSNNDEQKIITNNLNNVVVDLELQQNQQQSASIVNV